MNLLQWLKNACAGSRHAAVHIPDAPHTPPIRRRCRFSGLVQGVGFRYEAQMLAAQLSLTGWAKNENDGTVVVEIEGEESYIDEFLRAMQTVPRFDITEVQMEDLPPAGTETTFEVRYDWR